MHSTASDAFINSCLATITHLIPVSAGVFYLVDRDLRPDHYILHGMPDKTHQQYLNHFQQMIRCSRPISIARTSPWSA